MIRAQQRTGRIGLLTDLMKSSAMRNRRNNLLETLADLEGTSFQRNAPKHIHFTVTSGRLTIDFSRFGNVHQPLMELKASQSSQSGRDLSVNEHTDSTRSERMREPPALALEHDLLLHAEPLPSYHRPGTAV